ncbi:RNA-directed DNA polymerase, partial [Patescibacteria group bacterium]|nr:RNA-directed DNA polymerase [Patescibacteria group bacterium]
FFGSIDHNILLNILKQYIPDEDIIWLLSMVVESFVSELPHPNPLLVKERGDIGLPLGNLTSQLFANIYLNIFDQFVKHKLKAKYYVRYADDFVFVSHDRKYLEIILEDIQEFLTEKLKLTLHPNKIFLQTTTSGIDFLGWKHFEDHRVLRKTTQKRMFARIKNHPTKDTLDSYLGLLKHGDGLKLKDGLLNEFWLNAD